MAPEMLRDKPSYSKEVDIWALGILLYELVHGRAPYQGKTAHEMATLIAKKGGLRFNHDTSPHYRDLVSALLQPDTTHRLPLIKVFDHPWVRSFQPPP